MKKQKRVINKLYTKQAEARNVNWNLREGKTRRKNKMIREVKQLNMFNEFAPICRDAFWQEFPNKKFGSKIVVFFLKLDFNTATFSFNEPSNLSPFFMETLCKILGKPKTITKHA